jgi:hypothetical protein
VSQRFGSRCHGVLPSPAFRPQASDHHYTHFPLLSTEYLAVHHLRHEYMYPRDCWDKPMCGPYDVPHHNDRAGAVCAGTVTYTVCWMGELACLKICHRWRRQRGSRGRCVDLY